MPQLTEKPPDDPILALAHAHKLREMRRLSFMDHTRPILERTFQQRFAHPPEEGVLLVLGIQDHVTVDAHPLAA